jgi:hypothetical protein
MLSNSKTWTCLYQGGNNGGHCPTLSIRRELQMGIGFFLFVVLPVGVALLMKAWDWLQSETSSDDEEHQ